MTWIPTQEPIEVEITDVPEGGVDVNIVNDKVPVEENKNGTVVILLKNILDELKLNNKFLQKIYNPE